jgi:2-polyprenyl-3-methyl-5-hydroxy-6-metoxy-1,4-benzoquinol methylase
MKDKFKAHEIEWNAQHGQRIWNYYADNGSYSDQYFSMLYGKAILEYVAKYVSIHGTVIDFGCATGHMMEHIMSDGKTKTIGLDFSEVSIDKANKKVSGNINNLGNFYTSKLPFLVEKDSADLLMMIEVIEHIDDSLLMESLKETHRLLKKSGIVVITTPNDEDLNKSKTICPECGCIFHKWQHVRKWNSSTLEKLMIEVGFEAIHIGTSTWRTEGSGPLQKLYRSLRKFLNRKKVQPHLIYIGKAI